MSTGSFAQDKMAKAPKQKSEKAQADAPKEEKQTKLKKDGTPDMRYAENKKKADKPAGPLKKDGTPDMRHKANKEAAAAEKKK